MLLIRVESQGCSVAESVTINAGWTGSIVEITVPVSQLRGSNYPEDEHAASSRLMLFTSTETVRAIR